MFVARHTIKRLVFVSTERVRVRSQWTLTEEKIKLTCYLEFQKIFTRLTIVPPPHYRSNTSLAGLLFLPFTVCSALFSLARPSCGSFHLHTDKAWARALLLSLCIRADQCSLCSAHCLDSTHQLLDCECVWVTWIRRCSSYWTGIKHTHTQTLYFLKSSQ